VPRTKTGFFSRNAIAFQKPGRNNSVSDSRDFPGAYVQSRYRFALGNKSSGDLWLKNGNGVITHSVAKRQGLMLSLGGDAVVISMNQ
jgi:hypothetical protein